MVLNTAKTVSNPREIAAYFNFFSSAILASSLALTIAPMTVKKLSGFGSSRAILPELPTVLIILLPNDEELILTEGVVGVGTLVADKSLSIA